MGLAMIGMGVLWSAQGADAKPKVEEWSPGTYMAQAVERVLDGAGIATKDTEYGFIDGQFCVLGAYLPKEQTVSMSFKLKAGTSYMFIGGGDDDANDVDLYLKNAAGTTLARDEEEDATPIVAFEPTTSGSYSLVLNLQNSDTKASFCALVALQEGGFEVPVSNLDAATKSCLEFCAIVSEKMGSASFHQKTGEWALYGGLLKSGSSNTISGLDFEAASHAIVATGDDNTTNIDLALLDANGATVEEDIAKDATPIVTHDMQKGISYKLKISNKKSTGAALIIAAVLDINDD